MRELSDGEIPVVETGPGRGHRRGIRRQGGRIARLQRHGCVNGGALWQHPHRLRPGGNRGASRDPDPCWAGGASRDRQHEQRAHRDQQQQQRRPPTPTPGGRQSHGRGNSGWRLMSSCLDATCQGFRCSCAGTGVGAVARMKRSSAATTAAASSGEACGATMDRSGRRFTVDEGNERGPPNAAVGRMSCLRETLRSYETRPPQFPHRYASERAGSIVRQPCLSWLYWTTTPC